MALVSQGFVSLSSNSHHQEVYHQGLKNDSSGTGGSGTGVSAILIIVVVDL